MKELTVMIADDDAMSRDLLHDFIQLIPDFRVIGEASDGEELIQLVIKENPDLVLVDINMPGLNGLEAVKTCKSILPLLHVVFTTGHDEFAVEAFNISAIDYIVKPIERTRLFTALDKTKKSIQMGKGALSSPSISHEKKLTVKTNNTFLYLPMEEILYIEKEGRKTVIHTESEKYETNESLQTLESKLEPYFFKTHRSFLVNLKRIIKIEAVGESYLAFFSRYSKTAHISKLKINEVQENMKKIL